MSASAVAALARVYARIIREVAAIPEKPVEELQKGDPFVRFVQPLIDEAMGILAGIEQQELDARDAQAALDIQRVLTELASAAASPADAAS